MIARSRPSALAAETIAAVTSTPVAPVQETTTSASASSASSSPRCAERAPYSPARRAALTAVRLATVTLAAPRRDTVAVASPAIAPAPSTSTRLPARSPAACWLRSRAAVTRDGAARSMSVSARARLPTRRACWNSELSAGPTVPISWPLLQRLAGLAEDLALAERHRVEPGDDLEQVRHRAVVVVDVQVRQHRLGALTGPVDEQPGDLLDAAVEPVHVGVDLEPVAGGDHGRLGDVLAGGDVVDQLVHAVRVERDPLEQRDRRGLVGDAHRPGTLIPRRPLGLALLVVRQDLQLDGQVDLAHVDLVGDVQDRRREVQDAGDPAGDHPVGDVLGGDRRGGDHADRDRVVAGDLLEVVERAYVDAGDDLLVPVRVRVEQRHDPEPAAAEPGVVGERLAEVADADDDHGPVLGHADLAGDLVAQVVDVVPDAAGAVAAEVGEVLAELGAVDAGRDRELLARAGRGALLGQRRPGPGGRRGVARRWPRGCPGQLSGEVRAVTAARLRHHRLCRRRARDTDRAPAPAARSL